MTRSSRPRAAPPPLDAAALDRLAVAYVGRYATTRAQLLAYLRRKIAERGAVAGIDADAVVARAAALGYVSDESFAAARADALARRGFGARRVAMALRAAGIDEATRADATRAANEDPLESALAFARRKRLGPFASERARDRARQKAFAAFARAGHDSGIARLLVDREPGEMPDIS